MTQLTHKQVNQLRYELKRTFLQCVEPSLDKAVKQVIEDEPALGDRITIELRLTKVISKEVVEGHIQLK